MDAPASRPAFAVSQDGDAPDRLVAGFSAFGLAGLTAADYLVDHLDMTETGHVTAVGLPAIAPFEDGTPRHHTRIYERDDVDTAVLVNELFVPPFAGGPLATALVEWAVDNDVEAVTVLAGVPVPHGPDAHRVFHVATESYPEDRLPGDAPPMGNGFFDGVNAGLLTAGMESDLPVGVLLTPVHAQPPDVEAALRLVDAGRSVLDVPVETAELETFAAEVEEHYRALAERVERRDEDPAGTDRMYM